MTGKLLILLEKLQATTVESAVEQLENHFENDRRFMKTFEHIKAERDAAIIKCEEERKLSEKLQEEIDLAHNYIDNRVDTYSRAEAEAQIDSGMSPLVFRIHNALKSENAQRSKDIASREMRVAEAVMKACDNETEKLGLQLYERKDKHGWSICDDAGHLIRSLDLAAIIKGATDAK